MATVYVENRPCTMDARQNLLHGCLSLGMNLPYFCWHPALGSVGACRQCAVKQYKDENDRQGKMVMACMTPAAEGTRISIEDPEAVVFRRAVIEGLMLNHPHDCPVCDEGGECHLQDMTVMTGHDYRQYRFEKRTFRNQYLGPLLNHEMNRCIQCYRCVRYYREYCGGRDLHEFSLHNTVYFGRDKDGVLENEFAGNLAEVCPTGVFTDRTAKHHYTRKWDLQMAPSICVHCGVGCNISVAERYGTVRRIVNRYNREVNGYFLCDRGRFGYEFVNSQRRLRDVRGKFELLKAAAAGGAIGIGSPRASLESNFALRRLVGAERFYAGIAGNEARLLDLIIEILRGPARAASPREIEESDAVFILGEDLTSSAARLALSARQSVRQKTMVAADRQRIPRWMDQAVREFAQNDHGPLFIASGGATRLDDVATRTFRGAPEDLARLGFAVAHALNGVAPGAGTAPDGAAEIAEALRNAERPVVISGTALGSAAIVRAAANIAWARPGTALAYAVPEANSLGLALMGAPALDAAFQAEAETVIVLENDLYRRAPAEAVEQFLARFRHIVALDSLENGVTQKAELVLPAATFAESSGTFVSGEGRAQRAFRAFVPAAPIQDSWRWLGEWSGLDEVIDEIIGALPQFAAIRGAAPNESFRMSGQKIPREPHRFSGRTAMLAQITVHEPRPPDDPDSALAFSMEGYSAQPSAPVTPFFWAPGWNSYQAVNKFQEEIAGPLRGGPPGVRLFEPADGAGGYFGEIPPPFEARSGEWLLVPVPHLFGSEELSRESPAVAELAPPPYLALNRAAAGEFGAEAEVLGRRVPVRVAPELPDGVAAIPAGMPPFEGLEFPLRTAIRRVS